jgi:hypothetical protein
MVVHSILGHRQCVPAGPAWANAFLCGRHPARMTAPASCYAAYSDTRVSNLEQFIANVLLKLRTLFGEENTSRVNAW